MESQSAAGQSTTFSLPHLDLPHESNALQDAEASFIESSFTWSQTEEHAKLPTLVEIAASVLTLLNKYTSQDDIAVVICPEASDPDGPVHVLHVTQASCESLSSLEAAAACVIQSVPSRRALQAQVVVAEEVTEGGSPIACSGLELQITACRSGDSLKWRWRRSLFSDQWVTRAQDGLCRLLKSRDRDVPLKDVRWLSDEEEAQVLHTFNRTAVAPASAPSVLHAVAEAVRLHSGREAVRSGDGAKSLSYAQLWDFAGRLAAAYQQAATQSGEGRHGVGPGVVGPVAVLLERGVFMVAALLGAWRAGGACMPLDLRTPRPRLEQMLKDAEVRVAVTSSSAAESLAWVPCAMLCVEDLEAEGEPGSAVLPALGPEDPAYILFTSGSTGVPKGVVLTHKNLMGYIGWHVPYYGLGPEDRVPHLAGLSFDASMAEIWPTLCVGGCVLPAPDDDVRLLPEALCRWYTEAGVTVSFLTTQLAEAVLSEPGYPSRMRLRVLFTGGDKLHFGPASHAPFQLVNIYGPTECTVNVTMCLVPPSSGPPSIGQPVPGCQLYVLDQQKRPQPPGVFGDLFVGGPQVGAGYLKRPDLTAQAFVCNPFAHLEAPSSQAGPTLWPSGPCWEGRAGPAHLNQASGTSLVSVRSLELSSAQHGTRLYRTGDLARWTAEGTIDFLGRADCQVKIRGQRIELGEIESKLLQHQAVRECVVVCRKLGNTDDKYLAAYWAAEMGCADDDLDLTAWLKTELPEYMVPKVFVRLTKLPVNANGKVDRKALPEPEFGESGGAQEEQTPESPASSSLEAELRRTFAAVLGRTAKEVPLTASFFSLGGHSLSVGQLVNRIRRDLQIPNACLADVYSHPTVQALAAQLRERQGAKELPTLPAGDASDRGSYPCSFQQLSLYGMAQLDTAASAALNLAFCCHIRGSLDVARLQQAFRALSLRHDALRSTFMTPGLSPDARGDRPRALECKIQKEDCLDFSQVEAAPADLAEWLLDQQYEPFDLVGGPLCRVRLAAEPDAGQEAWILHWTLHHVSADLWSYTVLLQELGFAYDSLKSQAEIPWPSPAPQYRHYASEEAKWLDSQEGQASLEYWLEKLQPAPPTLELPDANRRTTRRSFKGSKVDFQLDRELLAKLTALSRRCSAASAHPVLLAAWMVLLSRHAQEEDVCVGIPMACRTTSESEAAVGYFVNPLCVRAAVSGSFEELVRQVALDVQGSLQHQRVPLAHVCDRLGLEERNLLQSMFVFQTCPGELYASRLPSFFMGHEGAELPLGSELRLESVGLGQRHAQFDLALMMANAANATGEHLIGSFQYNSATFSRESVLRLQAQFKRVLEFVVSEPWQDISQVQLFGAEDVRLLQQRALTPWPQELPAESLPELIVAQAKANPSAFAVVGPDGTVTFGDVLCRAETLAAALLGAGGRPDVTPPFGSPGRLPSPGRDRSGSAFSSPGLRPQAAPGTLQESGSFILGDDAENPLVGLMVNPGRWMVAGPLGAWLAGRGYFPLDPGHPAERIQQMVQDARPQYIVCERKHQSVANSLGFPVLLLEDLPQPSRSLSVQRARSWPYLPPEGRGVLIFTSGSTGRPKGVLLSIRALLTHVLFTSKHFGFKPGQAVLQHTSWTFDAPICEIWPALLAGATVVVSKRDGSKDFDYIASLVHEHRVSHALFVPSLLAEILEHQALPRSLRSVMVVGEACSLSLARRILEAPLSLNNFYGPSEGGIGATIYVVDKIGSVPPFVQTLPVGRPVSWRQVLLLDSYFRPAVGRAGQIAILGEGLAIGYLHLPEETKKRFIRTPQAVQDVLPQCGSVMYLTGDVGRYCQDDLLEFVGRLDNQVKLRGQRVELGEVEETLLSAPAVTEAVALVHSDRLIGYFSTLQGVEEGEAVRQCVEKTRQRLPRYMWPELVHITEWPRGRTGKVDRKALPVPTICVQDTVPPRTPLEEKLLSLFCQVLRREPAVTSVHSDFFMLGGTSLRAASLLSALRAMPEASSLQFDELYAHPTVAGLAEILSGNRDVMTLGPAPVDGLMPASLGQEHMLVLQELQPNSPAYNSPLLLRLDGAVDRAALATAIERVIARHDVLRSNLLRDFVDGEHTSGVIQVTTPAAEFSFEAEYWPSADETGQRPLRLKLRPRLLGARLPDRLPDRTETLPDVGGGERASSFNGRVERLGSWFGLGASPRGARTGSWLSPRPSTRSWRNWFFTPPSDRQEASPRGSLRYPNSVQASPGLFMGYASPPVGSPELNPRAHPLLQNSSAVSFQMNEMSSSSCSSVNFLDENGRNGSFRSSNDSVCPMAMSWLQEEVKRPFDLRDDPLIRVVLAKVGQQTHLLLINLHHSVTDGRSLAVLRHELTAAYRATVLKQDLSLPSLSMQYADFAYWQRQWMAQGRLEKQLAYWRVQLQGLPALQLPTDFVRPAVLAPDGGQVAFEVPAAVASQLRSLARAKGSTLFAVLLGLFAATLGRYGDALDLAIASPVANRNGPEVEPLMGYFVNTVIFRAIMQPPCSFEDLLQRLRETVVGAFKNAEAPYAVVLEAAQLDAGSVPAMFVLQDNDEGTWSMENLRVEPIELNRTSALFDVTLEMQELPGTGRGLRGLLVFNTNLWTATRAARFTESFQALAAAVAEQPGAELLSLSALSSADRTRVLEWGGHNQRREAATPLVKALQMQLLQRPQRPAIIDGDLTVSYAEFGVRVAALAAALKKKIRGDKGSAKEGKEEALLGLLLPRSIEMAVSIWACFGAGAAYVPIDPEYPAERISHILSSAMPRLVLCREEDMGLAHGVPVFRTSEWPGKVESADTDYTGLEQPAHSQLAYVIYTSGSTGRPKGVAVEHKSAANMVKEQLNLMQISPEDRVLQFFKPAFDGAVQEYLSTPCGGAALVLWDASKGFGEAMARQRVSAATLTPSALAVLEPSRLPCLSKIAVAAEACPPALIVTWSFEGRRLVNAYGPSEATVVATSADLKACGVLLDNNSFTMEVSPMNVQSQRPRSMSSINSRKAQPHQHVPIGKPLRGVQCYVFEPTMGRCLQPVGAPGELCLGGIQLARGYLGDSAKTTEKFVANPLDGARMYKTGDLVTWLSSGELLYLGRNDEMVKVRGFRVELTEVEAALSNLGAQAVAVGLNANKDALWAWVTPQSLAPQTLRAELLKSLPQYMVPQRIFPLEKLPLTPNGKIDKKRLLADTCAEAADTKSDEDASGQPFVEPQTALEGRLCAAAAGCLGLERLGVTADLKEAGMTSLKAVLLSQKLRDMGLTMPLSAIYELQNIRAMAEHLATQDRDFADDDGDDQDAEESCCCCSVTRVRNCSTGVLRAFTFFCLRICTWIWISGIVTWPAVLPLKFAAAVALPRGGLVCALAWLVLAAYPLYLLFVALLVVLTKWAIVGQYRAGVLELDSFAFLRWWAVDRTVAFVNDLCMGAFRGGPIYFAYLCALGLKARGYCRIDTRHVSEFDLISLGRSCAIAEGAKLRPATAEASLLQLRPMVFGDRCAVGENAVCTAGCVVGQGVTLQPLSLLSGRTGRTLPDGSVWKGSPLVQSRQQPIRVPTGRLSRDLVCDLVALLLALALQLACAGLAHCVFGTLAQAQGFKDSSGGPWQWKQQAEGWLFAATWLLFGPPVMASADVLLGLDLASCADQVASAMGIGQVEFGLRLAGMIVVSFAAYGWALTLGSAMLCRLIRGSRRLNSRLFQVRRLVLRLTFPRYPAQLSGTWAMSLYLRVSGGRVALSATVAVAEPPLEPRKLRVAEGALVLSAQALGECEVGKGSIVGADSVMLPHTEVESGAVVGAMSVVGRPVRADLQLVGNPGVIMHRATLGRRPRTSWARRGIQRVVWMAYPLLAPMLLQLLLLITLLPAMYFLTVLLDTLARNMQSEFGYLLLACLLAPAYVLLGWCLCLVAVLLKWLVIGRVRPDGRFWRWYASCHHHLAMFSQGLNAMSIGVFMGMAMGSPFYNWWLKAMGARVASDALLLTPVVSEHDTLSVGSGAAVDKEAILSSLRLLPVRDSPETVSRFCTSVGRVSVGAGSTVSHGAAVVAAETGDFSVLAPLSAVGPSMRLPPRTLAVGSPPQKFSWSRDRDNLVRPTARPLPRELRPPIRPLPAYVSRAINRIKVVGSGPAGEERLAPLVTGACGFLGRHLVKALLETKGCSRVFAVARASDAAAAQKRVVEALCKAGVTSPHLLELVEAVPGDLSQRNFGRSFAEQQRLAGRVTHVFHSAAKVNLSEPFDMMRKDNVEATAHVLEFCCLVRPKPFHHISTMGVITPDMLDRHGAVREAAPLGDIRSLPLYGTGDQANGYPQTKWLAEMLVYEAARQGLPAYVHRPGLIGGCSETGAVAQDVFYHFLYDVLQLRRLPAMEGNKFNLTPVDWVAKAIVKIATGPGWVEGESGGGSFASGSSFHPAAPNNSISVEALASVLRRLGYRDVSFMDFVEWRDLILADPIRFKSWSFCAALTSEGDGIDSMADSSRAGAVAMCDAVGKEAFTSFDPKACLERMLRWCAAEGLLPVPEGPEAPSQGRRRATASCNIGEDSV